MNRNLYLALGDSITAGIGASHPQHAYISRVSRWLKQHGGPGETLVVARNGWTVRDVFAALWTLPPGVWERVQVLTLLVGGNDLRQLLRRQLLPWSSRPLTLPDVAERLQTYAFHLNDLCRFLSQQRIPQMVVATCYNPVPQAPLARHAIETLNAITEDTAKRFGWSVVDVYAAFCGREAQWIDGFRRGTLADLATPIHRPIHPNDAGHQAIADLVIRCLERLPATRPET
ncbi:MAG: SGNH/GDSL hydrolase family protein [Alicyclobacillus sp.]|nr:SGNH/GDSL hydrolase family protein [Alicyclobacillus sp.]